MEKYFDNRNILMLILKWKYHFGVILLVAAIAAVIFSSSWFITPLFKSYAIVYPANISEYSEESPTEQMLQMLQSRDIKDQVIKKFDLSKHYKIDSSFKYFYTTLLWEYDQHISINKTPYESVEIEVMDKDPQIAADICDAIISFYDEKVRALHTTKISEVVTLYKEQLDSKEAFIDSLKTILKDLGMNYGLYEYESQSEEIMKGLLGTVEGGGSSVNKKEVKILNENMKDKAGELVSVIELIRNEARTYADVKLEYEMNKRFYTDKLSYSNVVTPPFPADKKSYPIRWLILVFTLVATFFLTLIVIMVIENYQSFLFNRTEPGEPNINKSNKQE